MRQFFGRAGRTNRAGGGSHSWRVVLATLVSFVVLATTLVPAKTQAAEALDVESSSTWHDGTYVISMDATDENGEKLTTPIPPEDVIEDGRTRNPYVAVTKITDKNTGQVFFCLEPEIPAAVGATSAGYVSTDLNTFNTALDGVSPLTQEDKEKLSLIYYFASQGNGFNDKHHLLAAQLMIWEAVGNKDLFKQLAFIAHDEEDGHAFLENYSEQDLVGLNAVKTQIEQGIENYKKPLQFSYGAVTVPESGLLVRQQGTDPLTFQVDSKDALGAYATGEAALTRDNQAVGADVATVAVDKAQGTVTVTPKATLAEGLYTVKVPFFPKGTEYKDPQVLSLTNYQTLGELTLPQTMQKYAQLSFRVKNVNISKVDVNTSQELAGATMVLGKGDLGTAPSNTDATFVEQWTSGNQPHVLSLAGGSSYTLFETKAPANYGTAESIVFKVDNDGNVLVKNPEAAPGAENEWLAPEKAGTVVMKDASEVNQLVIKKQWSGLGADSATLRYSILGEAPQYSTLWQKEVTLNAANQWSETIPVPKMVDNKPVGLNYRLEEKTTAAVGWVNLDTQPFTPIAFSNGKSYWAAYSGKGTYSFTVTNTVLTQVKVSKRALGQGSELVGAKLTVTRTDAPAGQKAFTTSWDSAGSAKELQLPAGEYKLVENKAPTGFDVAEEITFRVTAEGKVQVKNGESWQDQADATVVMFDKPSAHTVIVSKKALGQDEELPGAALKVTQTGDHTGAPLGEGVKAFAESWTSEGEAKELRLPAGTYTLVEDQAPTGYDKAEQITFRVGLDGKVQVKNGDGQFVDAKDAMVVMVDAPSAHMVTVSKKALGQGDELPGAKLSVTQTGDYAGAPLGEGVKAFAESWTSGGGAKELMLAPGQYVLTETSAPQGYAVAESMTFRVGLDGKVQVKNAAGEYVDQVDATVTMVDAPEVVRVELRKVWSGLAADSVRLRYSVLGQDSPWPVLWSKEVVLNAGNSWSASVDVPKWFDGKTSDKYKLEEKTDGDGKWTNLDVAVDTPNVMINGKSYRATYEGKGSYSFTVVNTLYTDVTVSKQILGQGSELAGAELSVSQTGDQNGAPLGEGVKPFAESWTSEGEARVLRLPAGTYVLVEDQAPTGYDKAEQITFRVTLEGKVQVSNGDEWQDAKDATVTMLDALTLRDVTVSKQVLGQGTELAGAELSVSQTGDYAGAPLGEGVKAFEESWMSEGEARVLRLPAGTYTLVEDQAPTGYDKAEQITFRVTLDGKVQVSNGDEWQDAADATVVMFDALSLRDVTVSKQILGQGSELAGAKLSVSQTGDQNGAALAEGVKPFAESWMSEGEARVLRLPAGTYVLVEDQAPTGYDKAEAITFRVTLEGKVQVKNGDEWQDAADATVVMFDAVSVHDVSISKQILGQGSELAGAELSVSQTGDQNGAPLGEGVKPFAESWTSEGEARVLRLPAGVYELVEDQAPTGYDKAEQITFRVTLEGKVQVSNGDEWQDAKDATVVMFDAPVSAPTPAPSGPAPSGGPVPSGSATPAPGGLGVPSVSGSAVPSVSGQGGGSVLLDTGASASVLVVVAFVLLVLGGAVLLVRRRVQQ